MLAELQDIRKHFNQALRTRQKPVLNRVSLQIAGNESIAITGPSGSGKTTLLNILGTLDIPDSGLVILNGMNTAGMKEPELAALRNGFIGFVFQLHFLLPQLSLLENVLLPLLPLKDQEARRAGRERASRLIVRMGLQDLVSEKPSRLSVGECQRAAVARALVNKPRLLLADEPTGSLDAETAALMGRLLSELQKEEKLSMIVVTHSSELAGQMDKIYKLGSGKLLPISKG
ncbi:MAG: ATP-binding cassette domain-containing protein [Bacteroidetes bacterium]|nr:ATP-binding cassette domain-containing protein [Bacteroidota bacterium]